MDCKGRNGWFRYGSNEVWRHDESVHIEIFSKKRGGSAPIHFEGTREEMLGLMDELRTKIGGLYEAADKRD